ncbi:MAG TPA: hypothetical protein PL110_11135 [Candidatus Eremiobacteraeota bacterium]|nr:MAG: hypothetical protein BWY64_03253 [bacterium ADurb.Bin363]HPZ08659.1 hypothetical protein [Candidatus Eremiobacteraeota bacterium]
MKDMEEILDAFEVILQQSKFKTKYYRTPRSDLDYQFGIEGFCNIQLFPIEGEEIIVRCFASTSISEINQNLCLKLIAYNYINEFGNFSLSPEGVLRFSHTLEFSTLRLEELEMVIDKIAKGDKEALNMLQEEL